MQEFPVADLIPRLPSFFFLPATKELASLATKLVCNKKVIVICRNLLLQTSLIVPKLPSLFSGYKKAGKPGNKASCRPLDHVAYPIERVNRRQLFEGAEMWLLEQGICSRPCCGRNLTSVA